MDKQHQLFNILAAVEFPQGGRVFQIISYKGQLNRMCVRAHAGKTPALYLVGRVSLLKKAQAMSSPLNHPAIVYFTRTEEVKEFSRLIKSVPDKSRAERRKSLQDKPKLTEEEVAKSEALRKTVVLELVKSKPGITATEVPKSHRGCLRLLEKDGLITYMKYGWYAVESQAGTTVTESVSSKEVPAV